MATGIRVSAAKTWVAAAGTIVTALLTALAAVQLAVEDGSLGVDEIGSVAVAVIAAVSTVIGVFQAPRYTTDAPYVQEAEDNTPLGQDY